MNVDGSMSVSFVILCHDLVKLLEIYALVCIRLLVNVHRM